MRWTFFILLMLIGALLDGGNLFNVIAIGNWHVRPSILIVMVVFTAYHAHRLDAIQCAFAIGFFADLVSTTMGPHMIIYGLLGAILSELSRIINMKHFMYQSIVVFLTSLASAFPIVWLESMKPGLPKTDYSRPHLFPIFLGTALYTAVFAPIVWFLLASTWKRIYPRIEGRPSRR